MFLEGPNDCSNNLESLARRNGYLVQGAFPVKDYGGHLEPFLVIGLISLRRAVEPGEEAGGRGDREDGHAGYLVVLVNVEELVRVGVAYLYLHLRSN